MSKNDYNEHAYDDMIDLPHHVSTVRAHMSIADRAAQFAPFKAMVGLEDELAETARLTDEKRELTAEEREKINAVLREILSNIGGMPVVKVEYFKPDGRKQGGAYLTVEGKVKKIDLATSRLIFTDMLSIAFEDIMEIAVIM